MRIGRVSLLAILLLISCFSSEAFSQQLKLNGILKEDSGKTVPNITVVVAGIATVVTDPAGRFSVKLPPEMKEGQRVVIDVRRPGWAINYPLDGEWEVPNIRSQEFQLLKVIIVPKDSKALWTDKRIETYIARLSDEFTRQKRLLSTDLAQARTANARLQEEARPTADFSEYLNRWAREFGQTAEQVKTAFDEWAKATESSDDYRTLGLRQFYLKNFAAAADNFIKAALRDEERIKRTEERLEKDKLETYEDWKLAGNAQYNDYNFREAINSYDHAAKFVTKDKLPQEWARLEGLSGDAQQELGTRTEGEEGVKLIKEAVRRYRNAFAVYTREQFPQQWAGTQNNLGDALTRQGERVEGPESVRLLSEAVAAFREVLKVYTRQQFPQQWAGTQNNLGAALISQGERAEGPESVRLLSEAVAAFREALKVRTREQSPQDWATTQNNLGAAFGSQGERAAGEESMRLLGEAVAAFREALKVYTREQSPQDWAGTQNNLGNVLTRQGERAEESVRLLGEAVAAYREALKVYTREQLPQQWAMTQNNLGNALTRQGERAEGTESVRLLGEAVAAYREALKEYTRDHLAQQWAMVQDNLGGALISQGERAEGQESVRLLREAVTALREALKVRTRESFPHGWATTQNNLGVALRLQGERAGRPESVRLLGEAVMALREAMKVRTRERSPQDWAATQNNLGIALTRQGERAEGEESVRLLGEAVVALREALKVRTRESFPYDWATTQNNLGIALLAQGVRAEGQESVRLLGEAVAAYREALKVYAREQLPRLWAITQNNLARALYLLKDWAHAAKDYRNALSLNPDHQEAYSRTSGIYHDILFRFQEAYELNRSWLQRHPNDLTARTDFAEKNFTTGSFVECERMITTLLSVPEIEGSSKAALRGIEIANALVLGKGKQVEAKLDSLIAAIAAQSAGFKVNWNFAGTLHFIGQNEKLAPYREWLRQLFSALAGEKRDAILKALREAQAKFKG